ncbi:ParB-like dsDNA partitioning protein [Gordonia phage Nedarya]|nr:ParB-like dsDNA partitioning protein [Gordonia phage Nedarya]
MSLKDQLRRQQERNEGESAKRASEVFRGHKDVMGTLGIYLPKATIKSLKKLAFEEGTSASKIIEELLAPRLLEGPRTGKKDEESSSRLID